MRDNRQKIIIGGLQSQTMRKGSLRTPDRITEVNLLTDTGDDPTVSEEDASGLISGGGSGAIDEGPHCEPPRETSVSPDMSDRTDCDADSGAIDEGPHCEPPRGTDVSPDMPDQTECDTDSASWMYQLVFLPGLVTIAHESERSLIVHESGAVQLARRDDTSSPPLPLVPVESLMRIQLHEAVAKLLVHWTLLDKEQIRSIAYETQGKQAMDDLAAESDSGIAQDLPQQDDVVSDVEEQSSQDEGSALHQEVPEPEEHEEPAKEARESYRPQQRPPSRRRQRMPSPHQRRGYARPEISDPADDAYVEGYRPDAYSNRRGYKTRRELEAQLSRAHWMEERLRKYENEKKDREQRLEVDRAQLLREQKERRAKEEGKRVAEVWERDCVRERELECLREEKQVRDAEKEHERRLAEAEQIYKQSMLETELMSLKVERLAYDPEADREKL
ncbi:hypothetical protein BDV95DRAFT_268480 [Massariosphaeria phaeospora]|uniref:Uncharacterized protein n=1 Tax=Massariosphaeria phaeospora TaxID=100035 RepID=A0A7C8M0D7_9PLEO|nr:hypothetical protein BDV95DRAFT_268480 [Massariosphaeria phaeospora]